jgi:hypothetical protein
MADTIQAVSWALGQKCPLRQGPGWEDPRTAIKTLSYCRTYSSFRKRKDGYGVYDDVCVVATSPMPDDKNSHYGYPSSGFILSSQFSAMGGLPLLYRLCGDCPANGDAEGLAGCVGSFHLRVQTPLLNEIYSKELQEQLNRLIDRLGLASKLDAVFPQTRLQWFRFWIQSPIPFDGARLLHQLLEAVYEEGKDEEEDLNTFIKALERSINAGIPMYVNLAPPGHTDLGYSTVFSHCPRCKAKAPVERWKRNSRGEEIECAVCSAKYSPAKTRSSERFDFEMRELRYTLGQAEFEKFAARCLVAQGASEAEAAEIVEKHEEWERARSERWAKEMEPSRQHECFGEQVIRQGLKALSPKGDDGPGWLYSPEDAEEIIRRCERHGGKVLSIGHVSDSGELDECLRVSWLTSARKVLQKLRAKGCNNMFYVNLRIPKDVVEQWMQQQPE